MSDNDFLLDEFYSDAVSEVLNIGMGSAAATLSEMTDEEVKLSIPVIKFINRLEAAKMVEGKTNTSVSGIHQHFDGIFNGDALLLFPEKQSLALVRSVLKENITIDELSELEKEAMTEIGNVILSSCLCSMADMFGKEMIGEMPEFIQGTLSKVFTGDDAKDTETIILLLNIEFTIDSKNIQGYVIFLMGIESVIEFKKMIDMFMNL